MRRLLASVLALAFVGIASLALADDKPNPTGTWKWSVRFGDQTREMTLKLKLDGDKLTGAMVREGQETPIQDAKYKDGDLSFNIVVEANGQKMVIKKIGKLSGDTIKGKTEFERDGQTQSRDWEAKRAADPTGTWKWSVTFNNQTREMTLKLKLEGDKLTGAMVRQGQETAIQDAKYKDGDVTFTVVRERDGQKMTSKFSGKVSGDTIKGKVEFERQGQAQSRDWDAKRVKE
jgi:hypothetical protein